VQFDPLTQSPSLVVTRLLQAIGLLLFLGADLHHQVLLGLVDSFRLAPPGAAALFPSAGISLSQALAGIFLDAVRVSMPVVAVALFLNLAAALVTRFAHQMNVYFSLGLTANAAAGLFATALLVPALLAAVLGRADELRGAATMLVGPAALAAPAAPATPLALP
jgi:flagellar biosynthetic protein FliR